ncbi:zinc carboxypeptidase A 1 [Zeugodacus cucurbitae]|uniref:zinc carboxypeptidase A 1 n=1 Tax=Zeugodacus cucurbitae TaxID=28588 RepID=UPI000596A108|nr:zinc carboxypeptidase A 1 [Zeugodacus cucurbitae]
MSLKIGLITLLCLTVALVTCSAERVRYDNYRVYKVQATDRQGLEVLKQLQDSGDALNFLDDVYKVEKAVNIVVPPHKVPDFLRTLTSHEITYDLLEQNLQNAIDKDYAQVATRATKDRWTKYQTLNDNYNWLIKLPKAYPGVVTLIEGGKSYEKRSILGVKIAYQNGQKQKPGIFLEAGIHAREWIAPATATYIINELLTSNNTEIRDLAENYVWYIFPHANPDGYVYTHTTDRMWRKTRQPYGSCVGADPNRNWDAYWNTVGASSNPCDNRFAGRAPNSEIEVKSLSNYITSLKDKIQLYLSFHSFSQYLLYPNGHTAELPDNVKHYQQVYSATVKAISKRYETVYTGGNIYDAIYPAAGSSVDFAYTKLGIRMAFCFELRPNGSFNGNGMELPAEQIKPTAEELVDGLVAMVAEVKSLGYFGKYLNEEEVYYL